MRGGDTREVGVDAQSHVSALLRMELRGDHVFASDDGREVDAVIGHAEGHFFVRRMREVGMHKLEEGTAWNAR